MTDVSHCSGVPQTADTRATVADNATAVVMAAKEEGSCKEGITATDTVKEQLPSKQSLTCTLEDGDAEAEMPEYFRVVVQGMNVCGDSKCPLDSRPDWFDEAKFRHGQQFAQDYFFGLMLAEMLSLLLLFSFTDSLQPIIFTSNSDTPYKAFRRYLSTVSRVRSWYEDDPWAADSSARKNLRTVRTMHTAVRKRLNGIPAPTRHELTLEGRDQPIWSTLLDDIRADFPSACPFGSANLVSNMLRNRQLFLNQADMALTQFGFVGLILTHPGRLGAARASEADLDGFAHLWRTIGYLLGIEDRYNFCSGSLAEVRQRSEYIFKLWGRNMHKVTADWEHMSRCVVEGVSYYTSGLSFESSLCYLTWVLGMESPQLYAAMTVWQRFIFHVMCFVMCCIMRLPGTVVLFNWLLRMNLKRAETLSPARLTRLENRHYPYQECKPTICTRS